MICKFCDKPLVTIIDTFMSQCTVCISNLKVKDSYPKQDYFYVSKHLEYRHLNNYHKQIIVPELSLMFRGSGSDMNIVPYENHELLYNKIVYFKIDIDDVDFKDPNLGDKVQLWKTFQ